MTEYPFEAILTRTPIGWSLEVKDPNHNHAAGASAGAGAGVLAEAAHKH